VKQEEFIYSYIGFNKEIIFSDPLRQPFGKMTMNELTGCFLPNEFTYVCKEEILMYTYVPELHCGASLIQPSTTSIPNNCEHRFLKLSKTFWTPLHLSNQWLFVTPQTETFTLLCPQETTTLRLQNKDKLTLQPSCKGYSSYVNLYAMVTFTTNLTNDYMPTATIDFDCCFENFEEVKFEELPLHVPLINIMSSIDDLRIASRKTEEVQQTIKEQEMKNNQNLYMVATSWGSAFGIICIITICICCSCCCCKCCRN
jgi:hypothetical protein